MSRYPDLANPDLLRRVPASARSLLDVGCAEGALGLGLLASNPRLRLFGIEKDVEAAARAAGRYAAVAAVDVETNPLPFGDERFDCIVYGDVLEHLTDPWAVIARQIERLNPNGTVLICVPNIEHWSFVARLLAGTWAYEPAGLLDRTHLRWFTLDTMRGSLVAAGLHPCDVHPRVFDSEQAAGFVKLVQPVVEALGGRGNSYAARAAALQHVWRVTPRPGQRLVVGATMLEPVGGVSDLRIVEPLTALATESWVSTRIARPGVFPEPIGDGPRVLVLHRPILTGTRGLQQIAHLIGRGWVIVTEFDDHPDYFPALQTPENHTFAAVHAVQTTTPALAALLAPRNPNVAVFPNAIRLLPAPANFTDPDRVTLFFGALNRAQDWAPYIGVLNEVAAASDGRLAFCVVHDQGLFDALDTPRKTFTPTCDYAHYMRLLGACELSFMPLSETPFNRAKSDLKFIEAAACGVAALASDTVYAETIDDNRTGLIFRSPGELRTRLTRMVMAPADARAIGAAARSYVAAERMLAYQTDARRQWYETLWNERDALTESLLARSPALAALLRTADTEAAD